MEPFGEFRQDMRFAAWMHLFYSANSGKRAARLTMQDFMLYADAAARARQERTVSTLVTQLDQLALASPEIVAKRAAEGERERVAH